jgi:beta-phosphoglucomutase
MSRLMLPPFKVVILDMDGLLIDSEATYCHAWQMAAAELGQPLSAAFCASLFGQHADDVVSALSFALGPAFEQARFFRCAERHWREHIAANGIARMPGADALLHHLRSRDIPHALATNSDGPYARQCLTAAGLTDLFSVMVTRDQVAHGKPEPDLFMEAARRLGAAPADCLVLEDSETGLRAAAAAGMSVVLVQRQAARRAALADRATLVRESLLTVLPLLDVAECEPQNKE